MAAHPSVRALIEAELKRLTAHVAQWETISASPCSPKISPSTTGA